MTRSSLAKLALAALLGIAASTSGWAQAITNDMRNESGANEEIYSSRRHGEASFCDDRSILSRIESKFQHQVRHVPELPDVAILDFQGIHEHRNHVASEDWPVPRRYCGATVALSDGDRRDIWYLIEGGMGLAGISGDGVEFCVDGFDRWYVYNGRCRVLR